MRELENRGQDESTTASRAFRKGKISSIPDPRVMGESRKEDDVGVDKTSLDQGQPPALHSKPSQKKKRNQESLSVKGKGVPPQEEEEEEAGTGRKRKRTKKAFEPSQSTPAPETQVPAGVEKTTPTPSTEAKMKPQVVRIVTSGLGAKDASKLKTAMKKAASYGMDVKEVSFPLSPKALSSMKNALPTHLLVQLDEDGRCLRTQKYLQAILCHCYILSIQCKCIPNVFLSALCFT